MQPRLSFGDFWKHTFQRTQCSGTVHSAASGATTDGFIGAFVLNGAASMRKGIRIEVPKKTPSLAPSSDSTSLSGTLCKEPGLFA
ncbi:hypothetical protein D9758_014314 [Tetrapyrgos nigripes]|uniref:Uncharacterized protein n=1 Tax=Tetrapyrgos nigripes TaxID=182062 RepID=A0A8H5CC07_9AGAR|nr:hypothetical protein D9758_014314 [Tetrapyrgos nigripes]